MIRHVLGRKQSLTSASIMKVGGLGAHKRPGPSPSYLKHLPKVSQRVSRRPDLALFGRGVQEEKLSPD